MSVSNSPSPSIEYFAQLRLDSQAELTLADIGPELQRLGRNIYQSYDDTIRLSKPDLYMISGVILQMEAYEIPDFDVHDLRRKSYARITRATQSVMVKYLRDPSLPISAFRNPEYVYREAHIHDRVQYALVQVLVDRLNKVNLDLESILG